MYILCIFCIFWTYITKKFDKNRVSGFLPFLPSSREERYFFRIGNNREKNHGFFPIGKKPANPVRKVNTDDDKQHLQNDTNKFVKWSENWQMFNFEKCKRLHTWHGNLDINYNMGDIVLGTAVKEKDLGITISADMKVSEQCGIASSRGNKILGLLRRNITCKEKKLIILLYKAIVRPHLEYYIQAWRPYRKKFIYS